MISQSWSWQAPANYDTTIDASLNLYSAQVKNYPVSDAFEIWTPPETSQEFWGLQGISTRTSQNNTRKSLLSLWLVSWTWSLSRKSILPMNRQIKRASWEVASWAFVDWTTTSLASLALWTTADSFEFVDWWMKLFVKIGTDTRRYDLTTAYDLSTATLFTTYNNTSQYTWAWRDWVMSTVSEDWNYLFVLYATTWNNVSVVAHKTTTPYVLSSFTWSETFSLWTYSYYTWARSVLSIRVNTPWDRIFWSIWSWGMGSWWSRMFSIFMPNAWSFVWATSTLMSTEISRWNMVWMHFHENRFVLLDWQWWIWEYVILYRLTAWSSAWVNNFTNLAWMTSTALSFQLKSEFNMQTASVSIPKMYWHRYFWRNWNNIESQRRSIAVNVDIELNWSLLQTFPMKMWAFMPTYVALSNLSILSANMIFEQIANWWWANTKIWFWLTWWSFLSPTWNRETSTLNLNL